MLNSFCTVILLATLMISLWSPGFAVPPDPSYSLDFVAQNCLQFSRVKMTGKDADYSECRISDFGKIGELPGTTYYYALYCLIPIYEKGKAKCGEDNFLARYNSTRALAVFEHKGTESAVRLLFERASNDVGMYQYDKPQIIQYSTYTLLLLPISLDGTGHGNESELYRWNRNVWKKLDTNAWVKDLHAQLPPGREIWKGIWPDYHTMTAKTGLWQKGDGNCCPTGGEMTIHLDLKDDKITMNNFSIKPIIDPLGSLPITRQDVKAFTKRVSGCLHWAGEVGDTSPERSQEIKKGLDALRCDSLKSDGAHLKQKYVDDPTASNALDKAGREWQAGMGEPLY